MRSKLAEDGSRDEHKSGAYRGNQEVARDNLNRSSTRGVCCPQETNYTDTTLVLQWPRFGWNSTSLALTEAQGALYLELWCLVGLFASEC